MSVTERLEVELPSELVAALRQAVQSGAYASEGDVLSALLGWNDQPETPKELEALRAAVAEGIADAEADRVTEADTVHAELHARIRAIADRRE